jgi:NADH-quinone oxidoreductase subunit K
MSIELMLLSVNLNFIMFSIYLDDLLGQLFVIFILTIAATESAIGLAILSSYYRVKNTIVIDKIKQIKG